MEGFIKRGIIDGMRLCCRQKIRNFQPYHDDRKVIAECLLQTYSNSNFLKGQQCLFFSQKNRLLSVDDPSIQKYLSKLSNDRSSIKNDKFLDFQSLNSLLNQREQVLMSVQTVNELQQGSEEDKELKALAEEEFAMYQNELRELDVEILKALLPRNTYENYSDIMVEISSGAGGQEAMLFASELLELYENYANLRGWQFFIESVDKSDLGGIKYASFFIHGDKAFYHMQNEIGVHRVQRVPVTSGGGVMHTSTAAVVVMPQPSDVDIKIADKDLVMEFMRASGPGGQNVNKTESAVRIKHLPTGLIVECQEMQSQIKNKEIALKKLRTKLYDIETQKQHKEISSTRRLQLGNRERSAKIRTYNFPQNRITDHRSQVTVHNIKEVMEGGNAFHEFLQKLCEQNESQLVSQFIAEIQQKSCSEMN